MPKPGVSNNPLGTLPADAQQRREQVEEDLACLYRVLVDMDELSIRIDQAMRRSSAVHPVLIPAQERLGQVRERLARLHKTMGQQWQTGQSHRWEA